MVESLKSSSWKGPISPTPCHNYLRLNDMTLNIQQYRLIFHIDENNTFKTLLLTLNTFISLQLLLYLTYSLLSKIFKIFLHYRTDRSIPHITPFAAKNTMPSSVVVSMVCSYRTRSPLLSPTVTLA